MNLCNRLAVFALISVVATVTGCGASGPTRSAVKGVIKTADGKPVDKGTLTFAPVTTDPNATSSPVSAPIAADGTFEVKGGAVVGKHTVTIEPPYIPYEAPEWNGQGAPPQAPPIPFAGMTPKDKEVTINPEPNQLAIELVPAGRP